MRRLTCFLIGVGFVTSPCWSQLKIDNAVFYIGSGATVTVQGDVISNVDILGSGLLLLKGTSLQNIDMGGFTIPNLELDNTAHATLLNTNARIGGSLKFTNGRLSLGHQTLRIGSGISSIGNASSTRFIETNGTGVVTKEGLGATAFTFPVGFSGTEFNPVSISNNGLADDLSVRCLQNVLTNGLTGRPITADFANNSWVITEAVEGGSDLNITAEWAFVDELTGFNRNRSGVARYNSGTNWDLPTSNVIAASGSGPFNRNRTSIATPGVFAIADVEFVNQADRDGRVGYSESRHMSNKTGKFEVTLFPVPTHDNLVVALHSTIAAKTELVILDIDGRSVKRVSVQINSGNNNFNLSVNQLPAGEYMLVSAEPSIVINKKFTVIR